MINRLPAITLSVLLVSLFASLWPTATEVLVYDRKAILAGEFWRLLSGHTVHFSGPHLISDLLVFGVAGILIEREQPRLVGWLYLAMGATIGIGLLLFDPALTRFCGLSGLAYGCVAYLALSVIQSRSAAQVYAWGILVALLLKILADFIQAAPVIELFGEQPFVTVPLSHLIGILIAGVYFVTTVIVSGNTQL